MTAGGDGRSWKAMTISIGASKMRAMKPGQEAAFREPVSGSARCFMSLKKQHGFLTKGLFLNSDVAMLPWHHIILPDNHSSFTGSISKTWRFAGLGNASGKQVWSVILTKATYATFLSITMLSSMSSLTAAAFIVWWEHNVHIALKPCAVYWPVTAR